MINRLLKIMFVLIFLCSAHGAPYAQAATVTLPKTGQIACYDKSGIFVDCLQDELANGQDGKLQKGIASPAPRFIDNLNGTFTDNLTGLIWLKNPTCTIPYDLFAPSVKDWPTALSFTDNLVGNNTVCSVPTSGDGSGAIPSLNDGSIKGDWRLPNRKELQSLIDRQYNNPSLPSQLTLPVKTGDSYPFLSRLSNQLYWSSSSDVSNTGFGAAWALSFDDGTLYSEDKAVEVKYDVWPVRGGHYAGSAILASPLSMDFANVAVNASKTIDLTISNSNSGGKRLQVNAMVLSGTDVFFNKGTSDFPNIVDQFKLNVGTCGSKTPIIAPGGSCNVSVTFNPQSTNRKTASLRVSSSDLDKPNVDIPLSGGQQLYTVGTSMVNSNGSITCNGGAPFSGSTKATCTITLTPGYGIVSVSGCGGTPTAPAVSTTNVYTYTTGTITDNCTVTVTSLKRNASSDSISAPTINDALRALTIYTLGASTAAEKVLYDVAPFNDSGIPKGNGAVDVADVIMILRRSVGFGSW